MKLFFTFLIAYTCMLTWADVSHISRTYLPVVNNDEDLVAQSDSRILSHNEGQQYYNNHNYYQHFRPNYPYGQIYGGGYYPQYFGSALGIGGGGGYYGSSGYQGYYGNTGSIYGGIGLGLGLQVAKPFSLDARNEFGAGGGTVIRTKNGYVYDKK
ncbi:uncharacterized protein LOC142236931 [Haematobia irritans]|uniref:uncharacterized protein LOC142236931 n=1 Tax=Haematobia irritans TaxID=7368 RepID=UPI003F4FB9D6